MLCFAAAALKEGGLLISRALQCVSAGLQANTKTKHLTTHTNTRLYKHTWISPCQHTQPSASQQPLQHD
jgi:hypothetical protein